MTGPPSTTPPPPDAGKATRTRWLLGAALGLAAFVTNTALQVHLLTPETPRFVFGGVFVLAAFAALGAGPGFLAGGLGLLGTVFEGGTIATGPVLVARGIAAIYLLEAWVAWRLFPRTGSLVLGVLAFWFGGGWLLDVTLYPALLDLPGTYVAILFIKQVFNGLLNAVLAELLLLLLATLGARSDEPEPLRRFVFSRFVLLVLPPIVLLGLLYARTAFTDAISRAQLRLQGNAAELAASVGGYVDERDHELGLLADRVMEVLLLGRHAVADTLLGEWHRLHPEFVVMGLADAAGRLRASAPDTTATGRSIEGFDVSARSYFQEARATLRVVVSEVRMGALNVRRAAGPEPVVVIAYPLVDPAGRFAGGLLASVGAVALRPVLEQGHLLPGATRTLLDRHRRVIASQDPGRPMLTDLAGVVPAAESPAGSEGVFAFFPPRDTSKASRLRLDLRYAAIQPVSVPGWAVLVEIPSVAMYSAMMPVAARVIGFLLAVPLLLLALADLLARRIVTPLALVRDTAVGIAEGRLTGGAPLAPLTGSRVREIRELAWHFMAMGRTLAERAAQTEEHFQLAFENPVVGILYITPEGRLLQVNDRFCELVGYPREELMAMQLASLLRPEHLEQGRDMWRQVLERRVPVGRLEATVTRKDGRPARLEWTVTPVPDAAGRPKYLSVAVEDITARRELEQQLLQAQKMEAIGLLAGGVAHDFNNLLTPIIGYTDMALEEAPPDSALAADLQQVRTAAERARDLTQQLLAFGRKQVLEMRPVRLGETIEELRRLIRPLIRENIKVGTVVDPDLGSIRADPSQVQQVLMNLCVNAVDAMPEGGRLWIEARNLALADPDITRLLDLDPGRYVALVVRDTGHGIAPEVRAHLFEPFFTTKERGKGTGLGLATVYGIVRQHGGAVRVDSTQGAGSSFTVFFPRVAAAAVAAAPGSEQEPALPSGGRETILVVEDEPAVRRLTASILVRQGYRVVEAGSGEEALERVRDHDGPIPLLLTDIVMPGMTGHQLYLQLREANPGLRVVFVSGYTGDALAAKLRPLGPGAAFLQKPFTPEGLIRRITEVLHARV